MQSSINLRELRFDINCIVLHHRCQCQARCRKYPNFNKYASAAITLPLDLDLWHRRLGHHHYKGVKKLLKKKLVTRMTLNFSVVSDPICEPCLACKMHANHLPFSEWRATHPLELVHFNVYQVPYPSFSGYHYWVIFIDDYSRFRFVLPIKAKSDVFDAFKQFKAYAENQSGHRIKILRVDKGGAPCYYTWSKAQVSDDDLFLLWIVVKTRLHQVLPHYLPWPYWCSSHRDPSSSGMTGCHRCYCIWLQHLVPYPSIQSDFLEGSHDA